MVLAAYEHRGRRADLCRKTIGKAIENYDAIGTPLKTHGKTMENTKLLTLDLYSPGNPRCPKSMAATRKGFAWFFAFAKATRNLRNFAVAGAKYNFPWGKLTV